MSQEQTQRSSIGAWKRQTPRGEVINFTINGQKYNMWPNSKKTKESQPDFNILEDNYVPQPKVAVQPQQQYVAQPQYVQPQQQYVQPQPQQPQQPQQGYVPASNGLNF
jgi:hypothetical protein